MNNLTPLVKGIITGVLLVAFTLTLFYTNAAESNWKYLIYVLYALGIVWSLVGYSHSAAFTGRFADLFGQGFRCFIIVTLIMVAFTIIFNKQHPEFAEEAAQYFRKDPVATKSKTPAEIEKMAEEIKKQYPTSIVSLTIFGYLITGAIFTAAGSALLMRRK
jgi:uncharacterized membrane protein